MSWTSWSGTPRGRTNPGGDARHLHRHGGYTSWHHKTDTWAWGEGGRTGFHGWAVRKQTIGDTMILRYLYDDRVYATHVCAGPYPSSTCQAVLHRSWTAILQPAVFGDGSGPFTAPDPASDFPEQELVVGDVGRPM